MTQVPLIWALLSIIVIQWLMLAAQRNQIRQLLDLFGLAAYAVKAATRIIEGPGPNTPPAKEEG